MYMYASIYACAYVYMYACMGVLVLVILALRAHASLIAMRLRDTDEDKKTDTCPFQVRAKPLCPVAHHIFISHNHIPLPPSSPRPVGGPPDTASVDDWSRGRQHHGLGHPRR